MKHGMRLSPFFLLGPLLGCGDSSSAAEGPTPFAEHPTGLWYDTRFAPRAPLMTPEERVAMERLGHLGYTDAGREAPEEWGVTIWDHERAEDGLNLYCSGHGAEALLIDMSGTVVHRWTHPYEELPGAPPLDQAYQGAWRRLRLFEDGSLIAIHAGLAIVKVDKDSKLLWYRLLPVHHDFDVDAKGHIFVLTAVARDAAEAGGDKPILDDRIVELDEQGNVLRQISLVEALRRSHWAPMLVEPARRGGDILHANTLELLREPLRVPHSAFRPGRVLVCMRDLDAIAVVDLALEKVLWLQRGPWVHPHQPSVLPDGRLLVFDNMGNAGYSRVLAYDVAAEAIVWQYGGDPPESFFSIFSGSAQRLPGGNTLVTESYAGRAFEVTPAGEITWEFLSPHRAGAENELVAVLFDVVRVPARETSAWLH